MDTPRVGRLKNTYTVRYIAHPTVYLTISYFPLMETQKNPQTMTRTEYVISNLTGVKNPMEFSVAEKMALRRLAELEKIVQGVSSKWFKNKSDVAMIEQTQAEMGRITQALSAKREKFGAV